jgi:CDP-4-dehydro-6-deoxyglucose reductase, E1
MSKIKIIRYPLLSDAFSSKDIQQGKKVLISRKLTMSTYTRKFESDFAKYVGAKYAIMANSGSSANLLAVSALCNPLRKHNLKKGDEILIPSLCWSTSLWPLVQNGLKVKFVDINKDDLNICLNDLKKKITKKTKGLLLVHVLGLCANMDEVRSMCKKFKLFLVEDTCESLGTIFKNKMLGTFGEFGTYSFYYSHQITCGEGGMVVCNNYQDYKILYSLRSHGWSRGLKNTNSKKKVFKNDFEFINSGYNLRPLDISAAIGINQLKRLKNFKYIRNYNRNKIILNLKKSKHWKNQFYFIDFDKKIKPSWFGLPIIISNKFISQKKKYIKYLEENGVETRPIISGNFANQPSIKLFNLNPKNKKFPNADEIEKKGFFIGLHTTKIKKAELNYLTSKLLKLGNF